MKFNGFVKSLISIIVLVFLFSLFFNFHDIVEAQNPNHALKNLLTSYVGQQVRVHRDDVIVKEVGADYVLLSDDAVDSQGRTITRDLVVPFNTIYVVRIGDKKSVEIILLSNN